METIQTTAFLRSARILWRVLETCCHSNSSERPSANTDVKNSSKYLKIFFLNNQTMIRRRELLTKWQKLTKKWADRKRSFNHSYFHRAVLTPCLFWGHQERMCTVSGPSSRRFYLHIGPLTFFKQQQWLYYEHDVKIETCSRDELDELIVI